jgi:addiction module HigA family antidote
MTSVKYIPAPPTSPGEVLRKHILGASITQDQLAKAMKVSRFSVSQIINGRRSITADMALRLAHVTSTSAGFWLNLQRQVDLYEANLKLASVLDQLQVLRQPKTERELFVDIED